MEWCMPRLPCNPMGPHCFSLGISHRNIQRRQMVFLLAYAGCIGPHLRIDNAPMRKYITMAIHYAIAIAIVLHVVSCVFIGESHMPGLQF